MYGGVSCLTMLLRIFAPLQHSCMTACPSQPLFLMGATFWTTPSCVRSASSCLPLASPWIQYVGGAWGDGCDTHGVDISSHIHNHLHHSLSLDTKAMTPVVISPSMLFPACRDFHHFCTSPYIISVSKQISQREKKHQQQQHSQKRSKHQIDCTIGHTCTLGRAGTVIVRTTSHKHYTDRLCTTGRGCCCILLHMCGCTYKPASPARP